jgi:hypothetical protein
MRSISSSGSVSPLAQSTAQRAPSQPKKAQTGTPQAGILPTAQAAAVAASSAQIQKSEPKVAVPSKNLPAPSRSQSNEPYNLGNAFAHYGL